MCPYYKKVESQINDMTFQLKKIKYIYIYMYICIKSKLNSPTQKRVNKKFRNKSNRKTKSMKCFAKEKNYIDQEKRLKLIKSRVREKSSLKFTEITGTL